MIKLDSCIQLGNTTFTQLGMSVDIHKQKKIQMVHKIRYLEAILGMCDEGAMREYWFATNAHI